MKDNVLIIGGAGGIGSAIVRAYLNSEHSVIVADIDGERGEALSREHRDRVFFVKTDVLEIASIELLIENISKKYPSIEQIISLAGGALRQEFSGMEGVDAIEIQRSIDLNLTSHIILVRKSLDLLKRGQRTNKSITFISSINAKMDFGLPVYSAAKSGLIGITKVLAAELGEYGIRVNVVLPGTVKTSGTLSEPKLFDEYKKGSLLGRFATEGEIADVVFCIANNLTCITGQEIIADCGQTVRGLYKNY